MSDLVMPCLLFLMTIFNLSTSWDQDSKTERPGREDENKSQAPLAHPAYLLSQFLLSLNMMGMGMVGGEGSLSND